MLYCHKIIQLSAHKITKIECIVTKLRKWKGVIDSACTASKTLRVCFGIFQLRFTDNANQTDASAFHYIVHFPCGPWLAGTRMSPLWISLELRLMEVVLTTGAIRRERTTKFWYSLAHLAHSAISSKHTVIQTSFAMKKARITATDIGTVTAAIRLFNSSHSIPKLPDYIGVLVSEGWWKALQPSSKLTRSY